MFTLQNLKKFNLGSQLLKLIPVLFLLLVSTTVSNAATSDLFKEGQNQIYIVIALITTYLVAPIAVCALIVLLVQVIMSLISGESSKIGQKLGWIGLCIIVAGVCFWLGTNARSVFN